MSRATLNLSEILDNVSLILVVSDVRYLRVDVKDLYELPKFLRFQSKLEILFCCVNSFSLLNSCHPETGRKLEWTNFSSFWGSVDGSEDDRPRTTS